MNWRTAMPKKKKEEIKAILEKRGKTLVFEKPHQCFNAGKTEFTDHKEFVFITKVGEKDA